MRSCGLGTQCLGANYPVLHPHLTRAWTNLDAQFVAQFALSGSSGLAAPGHSLLDRMTQTPCMQIVVSSDMMVVIWEVPATFCVWCPARWCSRGLALEDRAMQTAHARMPFCAALSAQCPSLRAWRMHY
jgi:hypothetical protein